MLGRIKNLLFVRFIVCLFLCVCVEVRGGAEDQQELEREMAYRVLVTFDVDGTLMQSTGPQANLLHKKAFSHAFLQVFGVEGTIDAIKVCKSIPYNNLDCRPAGDDDA